jgi:ectoine hydroxylase-related dioxygenase (phytanoyl-CoA dioxygenase family)
MKKQRKRKSGQSNEEIRKKPKKDVEIKAGSTILNQIPLQLKESKISKNIEDLNDSDWEIFKERYETDGYLLLKDFLDRDEVILARKFVLESCKELGFLDDTQEVMLGVCKDKHVSPLLLNKQNISQEKQVDQVLTNPKIVSLFRKLLDHEVIPMPYKWLRAVQYDKFTGVHMDRVYFDSCISDILHTTWIPLGDINSLEGSLMVIPGSHKSDQFLEYSKTKVGKDGTESGWLSDDANCIEGVQWHTTDFLMGDVCLINPSLIHMTTTNTTDRYRISCDVRWLLKLSQDDFENGS